MKFFKTEINNNITAQFENINLQLFKSNTKWKISVFINFFEQNDELESLWGDVASTISSLYQSNLSGIENEFEKWNIYIIYFCQESLKKEIKYKIENDKFSSRKIVEDNFKYELTPDVINKIIEKHITNTDLEIENSNTTVLEEEYPSESDIWKLLSNYPLVKGDTATQGNLLRDIIKNL